MSEEKEGRYCSICGGIPPDEIKIRRIVVEGKEVGIDRLDWILEDVRRLNLKGEAEIGEEILKRVRQFNYVPSRKTAAYAETLLEEYRRWREEQG